MQNSLGIITPDITRSLGFISPEAVRGLGIITPDITRSLGQIKFAPGQLLGVPMPTLVSVVSMSTIGSMAAGYAASRSTKGALLGAAGGLIGSISGIAIAGYIQKRSFEKLVANTQVA